MIKTFFDRLPSPNGEAKTTDAENSAFPYVLLANQFICTAWFYEQQAEPELFDVNRRMTSKIIEDFQNLNL